ncbi:MAG: permease-like cell division protein FtsX [Firmicutes bacterium]|nr:permease-like cell division protein FtsX [Bacillota bacterium]
MKGNIPFFWRETILSLKRNMLLNIASASTVMVLTFILGFFILIVVNINNITSQAMSTLKVKAILSDQLSLNKVGQLKVRILKIPSVESVVYISREEGLKKLKEKFKGKVDLENVPKTTLPNILEIKVDKPEHMFTVADEIEKYPGIVKANFVEGKLIDNLIRLSRFIYISGIIIIIVLLISAVFLIGNTIRLTVFSRRKEIAIMELVGASRWFIRGPFIIEGLLHGVVGSGIAVLLLNPLYFWCAKGILQQMSFIPIRPPGEVLLELNLLLIGTGILVATMASNIAVNKHLKI